MDKILKIQSEIGVLAKTETNPFFKSKYFDINSLIAQLLPLLEKYNLTVIQPLCCDNNGRPAIETIVYDNENQPISTQRKEELIRSYITLPDLQDPQKMGSAITYYRRYALQSLFLLQAEDDDANIASTPKNPANRIIEPSKPIKNGVIRPKDGVSQFPDTDPLKEDEDLI
jgi:hypothetical protein